MMEHGFFKESTGLPWNDHVLASFPADPPRGQKSGVTAELSKSSALSMEEAVSYTDMSLGVATRGPVNSRWRRI